jgi:hypothetical protein
MNSSFQEDSDNRNTTTSGVWHAWDIKEIIKKYNRKDNKDDNNKRLKGIQTKNITLKK